jgi:hypothetical protein
MFPVGVVLNLSRTIRLRGVPTFVAAVTTTSRFGRANGVFTAIRPPRDSTTGVIQCMSFKARFIDKPHILLSTNKDFDFGLTETAYLTFSPRLERGDVYVVGIMFSVTFIDMGKPVSWACQLFRTQHPSFMKCHSESLVSKPKV